MEPKDRRILVVDDENVVLESVRKVMSKPGITVDTADNPGDALRLQQAAPYDLVITDLIMPNLDGLDLIQKMQAMHASTRFVVITGQPTLRTALESQRVGALEYVAKPFTRQELAGAVTRALRR